MATYFVIVQLFSFLTLLSFARLSYKGFSQICSEIKSVMVRMGHSIPNWTMCNRGQDRMTGRDQVGQFLGDQVVINKCVC
jgi:hypothetical protein